MVYKKIHYNYILRLEKGEEVVDSLYRFCKEHELGHGWIHGLGGLLEARLGYYNLNRKKYIFRSIKDVRELVSLQGNISKIEEELLLHLHGVVSDSHNKSSGGHVEKLVAGGTVELIITTFTEAEPWRRVMSQEIGLPLLELPNHQ